MKNLQTLSDKTAISLSLLCAAHCLVFPLVVVLVPSAVALPLGDEAFHFWMLVVVLPLSAYALTIGCKKHKRYHLLLMGGMGLFILCATAFLGHEVLGENLEKLGTVMGASVIALGHFWNYRWCQYQDGCSGTDCHDSGHHRPE